MTSTPKINLAVSICWSLLSRIHHYYCLNYLNDDEEDRRDLITEAAWRIVSTASNVVSASFIRTLRWLFGLRGDCNEDSDVESMISNSSHNDSFTMWCTAVDGDSGLSNSILRNPSQKHQPTPKNHYPWHARWQTVWIAVWSLKRWLFGQWTQLGDVQTTNSRLQTTNWNCDDRNWKSSKRNQQTNVFSFKSTKYEKRRIFGSVVLRAPALAHGLKIHKM